MYGWARKYFFVALLALLMIQFMAAAAQAVDTTDISALNQELEKGTPVEVETPSLWWETLKMLLVLAVIVAAAWSIIRFFGGQVKKRLQGNWLHVVDEVMLGQNRGIVLCEVGQKLYALGVTDHSISCLFEVDNPQILKEISQMPFDRDEEAENVNPLKKAVMDWIGSRPGQRGEKEEFRQLMAEQVKRMRNISLLDQEASSGKGRSNGKKERT